MAKLSVTGPPHGYFVAGKGDCRCSRYYADITHGPACQQLLGVTKRGVKPGPRIASAQVGFTENSIRRAGVVFELPLHLIASVFRLAFRRETDDRFRLRPFIGDGKLGSFSKLEAEPGDNVPGGARRLSADRFRAIVRSGQRPGQIGLDGFRQRNAAASPAQGSARSKGPIGRTEPNYSRPQLRSNKNH